MVLFFTALLVISLVGLFFLFFFKHIESRTGKTLFLPMAIHKHDSQIEQNTKKMIRTSRIVARRATQRTLDVSYDKSQKILTRLKEQKRRIVPKHLSGNGTGSVYLKQVMDHRNNIREENTDTTD